MTAKKPVLFVCKSETQACLLASQDRPVGIAVCIGYRDGVHFVRVATLTDFGHYVKNYEIDGPRILHSLTVESLEAGNSSVYLSCSDAEMISDIIDDVRDNGFQVIYSSQEVQSPIDWPYDLFSTIKPITSGPTVTSYCTMSVSDSRPALSVGDTLWMASVPDGGGEFVYYFDSNGQFVAPHGNLPKRLSDSAIRNIESLSVSVERVSWGRDLSGGVTQTLFFEIPVDVSDLLSSAKLIGNKPR